MGLSSAALLALNQLPGGVPKAYLRVLSFNQDSVLVDQRTVQLTTAALGNYETLSTGQLIVQQDGYVSVYVGNESATDVYFDDVTIEHRQGLQVQENHYDPFGLDLAGVSGAAPGLRLKNFYQFNGKENQLDLGLNWVDYGARFYDSPLGMWHSIDLKAEKYYALTPYNYVFNNPVKHLDADGKDGIVAIKGNVITVSSNIYLYGSGATSAVAAQMQKDISNRWNTDASVKGTNGQSYSVNFNVNVSLYEGKAKNNPLFIPENWNPNNRDNFVEVGATLQDVGRSYVAGGDDGKWRGVGRGKMSLAQDDPAPHEFGHQMGLKDRYQDVIGPDKGWAKNIMGDSQNGKVDQRNINGILIDAMNAYNTWSQDKKNAGKTFKYEINIDNPKK